MNYTKFWQDFTESGDTLSGIGYKGCLAMLDRIKRDDDETVRIFRKLMALAKAFIENELKIELPEIKWELSGRLVNVHGYYQHTRGGRPVKITISKDLIRYHDENIIFETMAHEFLHYALHVMNKPFADGDLLFESLLHKYNLRSNYHHSAETYDFIVVGRGNVKRGVMEYGKR